MDIIKDQVYDQYIALRGLWKNKRALAYQILNLAMIVFSALMIWKSVMVLTSSESPVVVVLSGSMEPALQRGDILFLNNNAPQVNVGDIVVFKIAGRDIPIVHRVLWLHQHADTGEVDYLTKGDNNNVHDRNLYAPGQMWLRRSDILGAGVAFVPYLGMVTILLNDYPALKYVLVGLMGLFVLTGRES